MSNSEQHARILEFPFAASFLNAQLDAIYEKPLEQALVIDYRELRLTDEPAVFERQGRLVEQLRGEYIPRRLRFHDVRIFGQTYTCKLLSALPENHPARILQGAVYWRAPDGIARFHLFQSSDGPGIPLFSASAFVQEQRPSPIAPVELIREFSSPPLLPVGPIYRPEQVYRQYGGDPVTIHLDGKPCDSNLFVGGLQEQHSQRPDVDAVLNLSEEPSLWQADSVTYQSDRWATKGEGEAGMSLPDMRQEAQWVTERLKKRQSVLVHCTAGYNRSVTVCCATLMLLEGLSAEAALTRIREHHPRARPDGHHWLKLQGFARQNASG